MFLIQLLIGHKLTYATQSKYFGPFNYTFWSSLAKNKLILEIIGVKAVLLKRREIVDRLLDYTVSKLSQASFCLLL